MIAGEDQERWMEVWVFVSVHLVREPTSADGPIAHVARLAGTQVSTNGVGADGVLITQALTAGTLIMLWGGDTETVCIFCVEHVGAVNRQEPWEWRRIVLTKLDWPCYS